jgi:hypothetical protein
VNIIAIVIVVTFRSCTIRLHWSRLQHLNSAVFGRDEDFLLHPPVCCISKVLSDFVFLTQLYHGMSVRYTQGDAVSNLSR